MTEVIEIAQRKIAEHEASIAELRAFISVYERLQGALPDTAKTFHARNFQTVTFSQQSSKSATPSEIVAAAKTIMLEKERPLTRSELVRLLTLRGLKIGGKNLQKNVGTIIWRSGDFENVEGKGYWPLEAGAWTDRELFSDHR